MGLGKEEEESAPKFVRRLSSNSINSQASETSMIRQDDSMSIAKSSI